MANELVIHHPTGATLYALLFDATGQIYNGSTFGAPSSASWTDYDIAMSEAATATGIYRADMPAVAAGAYGWVVRKQAGGSPAVGDIAVGAGSIRWTGTAEEAVPAAVNVTYSAGVALAGRLAENADVSPLALEATAQAVLTATARNGPGTIPWTYTLRSDVDAAPIPQARIEVWNAANNVLITQAYTDNNGQALFYLDPGTYSLRRTKAGWHFINPDTETVEEPAP